MIRDLISCLINNILLFNILIDPGSLTPFNIVLPNKTCHPIISTIFGIVILISDEHSEKAHLPIEVTLFGIVIFVSDEHL